MPSIVLPDDSGERTAVAPRALWLLLGFVAVHVVLAWVNRIPAISWGEDDAAYIFLARELRHFSYRELQDMAAPIHGRFPPLYPLIIALTGWPFGDRVDALLVVNTLFTSTTIVLLFLAARRKLGEDIAIIASGLFAINPMSVWDSGHLMAEAPFKFFIVLGLWALTREAEHVKFAILAGAATIAAALTRSAGVVLLPALFFYWVINKRYKWALMLFLAGGLTVGSWLTWTFLAPDPEHRRLYVADLGMAEPRRTRLDFLTRTLLRLPERTQQMVTVVIPFVLALPLVRGTVIDNAMWVVAIVGLGVTGAVLLARRWTIAALVLVFYLGLLFVWRYALERFASPLVPFLLLTVLLGADWLSRRFLPQLRRPVLATLVGLLAFGALRVEYGRVRASLACDRSNPVDDRQCWDTFARAYLKAAYWVRDSTPPLSLFFVNKERSFYMHSSRKTINQDRTLQEDSLSLAPYLRAKGVEYAVTARIGVRSDKHNGLLARACRDFVILQKFPQETVVLRLRRATDVPDDGTTCRVLAPYRAYIRR